MVCKLLSHGGEILIPDRLLVSFIEFFKVRPAAH